MGGCTVNIKQYFEMLRHPAKRVKQKSGATLVELIAVVTILAIVASACVSAMFGMVSVANKGKKLSAAEHTCSILNDEFSIYGNTATDIECYTATPALTAYSASIYPGGFKDGTALTDLYYIDYFISAAADEKTIEFKKFVASPSGNSLVSVTKVDNIDSITFNVKTLQIDGAGIGYKYLFEYKINTSDYNSVESKTQTTFQYEIESGVVLNNTNSSSGITAFSDFAVYTKGSAGYNDGTDPTVSGPVNSNNVIRIRTTNRDLINMPEADVISAGP